MPITTRCLKFPVEYQKKNKFLSTNIANDLELYNTTDPTNKTINQQIFQPCTEVGLEMNNYMLDTYSYDKPFLKDTQKMLKKYKKKSLTDLDEIFKIIQNNKSLSNFNDKYFYLEWSCLEMLNKNEMFLLLMSIYNLSSPILSLIFPLIILILPFFILQLQNKPIEINEYVNILKSVLTNHAIGKVCFQFRTASNGEKIYILLSLGFYIFSIYQNIRYCHKFYINLQNIHKELFLLKNYIANTLLNIDHMVSITQQLKTYKPFVKELTKVKSTLEYFHKQINFTPFSISLTKILEIGSLLKVYYEFNKSIELEYALYFSMGFNGYLDNLNGLKEFIKDEKINFTSFGKHTNFKGLYYPALIQTEYKSNDCSFDKNIILTGPNASGKTTILKSCLINILLSQTFGCGCYKNSTNKLYKHIHCYLNIPDTLGRDSLFQAEARRCKEIIDAINKNPEDTHFCAFDELYSGTNPKEAISSATAFMEYIIKNDTVDCLLTTHFIDVCNQLDSHKKVQNLMMDVDIVDKNIQFKYELKEGISEICGGIDILKKLNYPQEILDSSQQH